VVVPLVNAKRREQFERIKADVAPDLHVHMLDGLAREAMIASDAALLASGTAALECMLAKCPMVVGYRMKPFTFWLAKRLVKTDYVSLPNLLAGRELVKELLQDECQPQALADALLPLLANGKTSHRCTIFSGSCICRSAVMPMSRPQMPYWSWHNDGICLPPYAPGCGCG
jgi:lipid-A-disaccharide synthase